MKKIFWIFVLVAAFLVPFKVDAVDLKLTYDNDFKRNGNEEVPVLPSYDDNGNIDGYLFLYKDSGVDTPGMFKLNIDNKLVYDKNGDELYPDDVSVKSIDTGNQFGDLLVTRYDDNEKVIFERKLDGYGTDMGKCVKSFNDKGEHDGYLLLLFSTSSNLKVDPGWIMIKINLKGDIVFEKNINEYLIVDSTGLVYTKDKKVDSIFGSCDGGLCRVDLNTENPFWVKNTEIDINNINYDYNEFGIIDGIVVVGNITDSNDVYYGVIAKYDLDGNEVFRYKYDKPSIYYSTISSKYVNGKYDGYIVAGISDEGTIVLKYDLDGNIVYKNIYNKNKLYKFNKIFNNYDYTGKQNGYILVSNYFRNEFNFNFMPSSFDFNTRIPVVKKLNNVKKLVVDKKDDDTKKMTIVKYIYPVYDIIKDKTDEGEITVSNDNAYPGEVVKVSVTPKEGYVLKRIVVLDENGKEIEVSSDGTFIMPEGKVTVTAIYNRISNPDTTSACYIVLGIVLAISVGTLIVNKKREEGLN